MVLCNREGLIFAIVLAKMRPSQTWIKRSWFTAYPKSLSASPFGGSTRRASDACHRLPPNESQVVGVRNKILLLVERKRGKIPTISILKRCTKDVLAILCIWCKFPQFNGR